MSYIYNQVIAKQSIIDTRDATITSLNSTISSKDSIISARDSTIYDYSNSGLSTAVASAGWNRGESRSTKNSYFGSVSYVRFAHKMTGSYSRGQTSSVGGGQGNLSWYIYKGTYGNTASSTLLQSGAINIGGDNCYASVGVDLGVSILDYSYGLVWASFVASGGDQGMSISLTLYYRA